MVLAELDEFFDDVALLIDLDGVYAAVFSVVFQLVYGLAEGPVERDDAAGGVQIIKSPAS